MIGRGRKSASEMAIRPVIGFERLPPAPAEMPKSQADIWDLVVKTPSFQLIGEEAYPVLTEYCRAVDTANKIANQINEFDIEWAKEDDGLKRWEKLLKLQAMMMARIGDLSLKLRIAPSSKTHRDVDPKRDGKRKPWEIRQEATETPTGLKAIA